MDNLDYALADLRGRVEALVKVCAALLDAHPDPRSLLSVAASGEAVRRDQATNFHHHYYLNGMRAVLEQLERELQASTHAVNRSLG
jgi:hypothetical protein